VLEASDVDDISRATVLLGCLGLERMAKPMPLEAVGETRTWWIFTQYHHGNMANHGK